MSIHSILGYDIWVCYLRAQRGQEITQTACTNLCHVGYVWVCYLRVPGETRKAWPGSQVHFSPSTEVFRSLVLTLVCSWRRYGRRLALKSRCQPLETGRRNCWRTIGTDPRVGWHPHHRRCAPPRVSPRRKHAADPQCTPAHLEGQLDTRIWWSVNCWRKSSLFWYRKAHRVHRSPPMGPTLDQLNPVCIRTPFSFWIDFKIIPYLSPGLQINVSPWGFLLNCWIRFSDTTTWYTFHPPCSCSH